MVAEANWNIGQIKEKFDAHGVELSDLDSASQTFTIDMLKTVAAEKLKTPDSLEEAKKQAKVVGEFARSVIEMAREEQLGAEPSTSRAELESAINSMRDMIKGGENERDIFANAANALDLTLREAEQDAGPDQQEWVR